MDEEILEAINSLDSTLHNSYWPRMITDVECANNLIDKIVIFTFAADRANETLKIVSLPYGYNGFWQCSDKKDNVVLVPHCSITTIKIIGTQWD